jgi:phosphatidylinositol glycan class F
VIGLLAIALNYGVTFKLPSTSLLKDPVQTLSTTVPVLFFGHIVLVALSHALRGTSSKAIVSSQTTVIAKKSSLYL